MIKAFTIWTIAPAMLLLFLILPVSTHGDNMPRSHGDENFEIRRLDHDVTVSLPAYVNMSGELTDFISYIDSVSIVHNHKQKEIPFLYKYGIGTAGLADPSSRVGLMLLFTLSNSEDYFDIPEIKVGDQKKYTGNVAMAFFPKDSDQIIIDISSMRSFNAIDGIKVEKSEDFYRISAYYNIRTLKDAQNNISDERVRFIHIKIPRDTIDANIIPYIKMFEDSEYHIISTTEQDPDRKKLEKNLEELLFDD